MAVTGVDPNQQDVNMTYQELRQSLPAVEDLDTFLSSHQVAIAQLAIQYCDALIGDTGTTNPYFPGFDFCFIATNIPRRYASMINKKGIEGLKELTPEAQAMIGPDLEKYFDPTVKAYAEMADMMGGHVPPNMLNIQTAQAAKDATMAHFSLKNFSKGDLLFHFEGSYHSNYNQGIIWWINKIQPGLDIKSITTVTESEWLELTEDQKATIADYIIVVADNMTQTKR